MEGRTFTSCTRYGGFDSPVCSLENNADGTFKTLAYCDMDVCTAEQVTTGSSGGDF